MAITTVRGGIVAACVMTALAACSGDATDAPAPDASVACPASTAVQITDDGGYRADNPSAVVIPAMSSAAKLVVSLSDLPLDLSGGGGGVTTGRSAVMFTFLGEANQRPVASGRYRLSVHPSDATPGGEPAVQVAVLRDRMFTNQAPLTQPPDAQTLSVELALVGAGATRHACGTVQGTAGDFNESTQALAPAGHRYTIAGAFDVPIPPLPA